MTDDPDHNGLQAALTRLSDRSYSEEGIPMMLVLENVSRVVAGVDPSTGCLGPLLREAAKGGGPHKGEHGAADLARLIEWIADSTFGSAALAKDGGEARDG